MSVVKIQTQGAIGELLLCGCATLNALKYADIQMLTQGLAQHEADPLVCAIVIRSDNDRAFCAGGDMKQIREHILANRIDDIRDYFTAEYALNLAISRCSKPYIALMHGITMGGGLGISVHGSVRVVTQSSMLAMPETRIGFFPDVGASYFLPRLKYRAGYWMGLTSVSINGTEALSVGMATHVMDSQHLDTLPATLDCALQQITEPTYDHCMQAIDHTLNTVGASSHASDVPAHLMQREQWFADNDLALIRQRLQAGVDQGNDDAELLLSLLNAGSPHAVKITAQLLNAADGKPLEECLELELALCGEAVRHPDCAEGIRAVLVDKDRTPHWL